MGKSKKKKNKDFQKVKLKVGRKLQRTNETKLNLEMKQIVLQTQNFEPKYQNNGNQPNLMKLLESIKSEDRLQCLKILKQVLEQALDDKTAGSGCIHDNVPIMWLPSMLKRFCFDASADVVRQSVTCFILIIKLLKSGDLENILYDMCSDLVRFLLASSKQEVRFQGVRFLDYLVNNLPVIFDCQFRSIDTKLTLLAINRVCCLEIKQDSFPQDNLDKFLSCVAKLLSALDVSNPNEISNDWDPINLSSAGSFPSVKRLQCSKTANHQWSIQGRQCGDWKRFTEDEFQHYLSYDPITIIEIIMPWIAIVETRLKEEESSQTAIICYSYLGHILLSISRNIELHCKRGKVANRLHKNVVKSLIENIFPVQIKYETLLTSNSKKGSNLLFTNKPSFNAFLLSLNLNLIILAARNAELLSENVDDILSYLKVFLFSEQNQDKDLAAKYIASLNDDSILSVLNTIESILISDSSGPTLQKFYTSLQDLVYSIHIRTSNTSLSKRRSVVVLTRAFKHRAKYIPVLSLSQRSCYQKLPSSLRQCIRKINDVEICGTFWRALYELQSLGLEPAVSVYRTLNESYCDSHYCIHLDKMFPPVL